MTRLWLAIAVLVVGIPAAAEPVDRGAYFKSLRQPGTGYSCCDTSDCEQLEEGNAEWRAGQWWAVVGGEWTPIPPSKILTGTLPLEGRGIVCASPTRRIYCFVRPFSGG